MSTESNIPDSGTQGESQSPEELRAEIERTQQQLGDTVEALAHKTDVKAQASARIDAAKESVQETAHGLQESVQHTRENFVAKAKQSTPESAGAGAQRVSATVQDKPAPFAAAGAFAAGVLVGWLVGRR
jgi:ElaB/YqjD/DUF883 family membrane-anchored ribosome-binding protein